MICIGAAMAFYQVCYFAAIARVGVAVAVLITLCTAPVLIAMLAAVFLRERLTPTVLLALICALAGTAMLVWVAPGEVGPHSETSIGVLLALASALGYAITLEQAPAAIKTASAKTSGVVILENGNQSFL